MFDNFSKKLPWQSLKQAIAFVLTIIALTPVVTALISSVNQPQIQSNIQLYQTNLNLQARLSAPMLILIARNLLILN